MKFKNLNEKGAIPAHTICPFRKGCAVATEGACTHKGIHSEVDFICPVARMFDMIDRNKKHANNLH